MPKKRNTKGKAKTKRINTVPAVDGIFRPQTYKEQPRSYYWRYVPLVILFGIVPLIVHTINYRTYLENYEWFSPSGTVLADVFLVIKNRTVILVGGTVLIIMLYNLIKNRDVYTRAFGKKEIKRSTKAAFMIFGVMAALVLLSALFSKDQRIAFFGTYESTEPALVLLSCFLLTVYTYMLALNTDSVYRDASWTAGMSMIFYVIIIAIGFFQIFGKDFFKTDMGKTLITSPSYWDNLDSIVFAGAGEYITLHNVDYVPVFFGMLLPVIAALFLMSETRTKKIRRGMILLVTLFCLFGAGADMGRIAFIGAAALMLFLFFSRNKKLLLVYTALIAAMIFFCFMVPQVRSFFVRHINATDNDAGNTGRITEITTEDDGVSFTLDGETYDFKFDYVYESSPVNLNKLLISLIRKSDGYEPKYEYFPEEYDEDKDSVIPQHYDFTSIKHDGLRIYESYSGNVHVAAISTQRMGYGSYLCLFSKDADENGYYYINFAGRQVKMYPGIEKEFEEVKLFPENLFSGRGRLWNRTIPILKKHIILGLGPASFITEYPQDQYYKSNPYTSKPHSMYLQFWAEEGLIFLICFLLFFGIYVVQTVKQLLEKNEPADKDRKFAVLSGDKIFKTALLFSILVFLINGIATDSMVVYSPIAWCLVGAGFGVNERKRF